jgi:septum formation protein
MNDDKLYSLILASNSPRRKELLGWLDIPFKVVGANIEEFSDKEDPKEFAIDLAIQKGEAVWSSLSSEHGANPFIVSSDTIVVLGNRIFGKPKTKDDAKEMLLTLSGKEHKVITSVYLKAKSIQSGDEIFHSFAIETKVKFSEIKKDILENYLASGESMDKAGAYGIQGKGLLFVESLEGSYSNVVGFPLVEFLEELRNLTCEGNLEDKLNWRQKFLI